MDRLFRRAMKPVRRQCFVALVRNTIACRKEKAKRVVDIQCWWRCDDDEPCKFGFSGTQWRLKSKTRFRVKGESRAIYGVPMKAVEGVRLLRVEVTVLMSNTDVPYFSLVSGVVGKYENRRLKG